MWANIVKSGAPPAQPAQAVFTSSEGCKVVVVDANAIINGIRLEGIADKAVTIQEVLDEVRDKQSRAFLASLAIKLEVAEPSEESLKAGEKDVESVLRMCMHRGAGLEATGGRRIDENAKAAAWDGGGGGAAATPPPPLPPPPAAAAAILPLTLQQSAHVTPHTHTHTLNNGPTVTRFARETGDIHALSTVDVKLLALAHTLEVAAHGGGHLKERPAAPVLRSRHRTAARALPGWGRVDNPEDWRVVDEANEEDEAAAAAAAAGASRIAATVQQLSLDGLPGGAGVGTLADAVAAAAAAAAAPPPAAAAAKPPKAAAAQDEPEAVSTPPAAPPALAAAAPQQKAANGGAAGADDSGDSDGDDGDGWETAAKSQGAARRRRRKEMRRQQRQAEFEAEWADHSELMQQAEQQRQQRQQGAAAAGGGGGAEEAEDEGEEQQQHDGDDEEHREPEELYGPQGVFAEEEEEEDGGEEEEDEEAAADGAEGGEEADGADAGEEEAEEGEDGEQQQQQEDQEEHAAGDAGAWSGPSAGAGGAAAGNGSSVACMTADFAMQNVLLQMGLRLLSRDGRVVARLSRWALRCSACFFVTREAGRLFCPKCGNMALDRVEAAVGPDGTEYFGVRRRHILRGTRYSLPKPRGGRDSNGPILREDMFLLKVRALGGAGAAARKKAAAARAAAAAAAAGNGGGDDDPLAPVEEFGEGRSQAQLAQHRGLAAVLEPAWKRNPNERKFARSNRRK